MVTVLKKRPDRRVDDARNTDPASVENALYLKETDNEIWYALDGKSGFW